MSNQISNNSENAMWRGALIPSGIVAIICLAGADLIRHRSGFWGALMASATVIIFFSIHLIINKVAKNLDPIATMALAMFSYFAKVLIMGAFLIIVTKTTTPATVDRPAFAFTALAITAAWLGGEIRAFLNLRLGLPLPSLTSPTNLDPQSDQITGGTDGTK
jgi:voltage-gated potassium channel Kch